MTSSLMVEEASQIPQWLPIWQWNSLPEYNCSRVLPVGADNEWSASRGVAQPFFGWWSICWGVVCEMLYIPCTIALYKERRHACYRIMLWLAIIDIIAIMCNSLGFGFLLIEGAVFCSRPWFVWIVGCFGLGMWCGACIGCLLLVTYRLFELMNMGRKFEAQANILIAMATSYTLYFTFFTPPVLTNSELRAMFYDPFVGNVQTEYVNWPHTANNLLIVLTSATLYILLCAVVVTKQGAFVSAAGRARISANGPIFIQASLICIFNVAASLEYIYMNFFPTPQVLVELGHISWQFSHGVPPFIYLLLNKSVKKHVSRLFFPEITIATPVSATKMTTWT